MFSDAVTPYYQKGLEEWRREEKSKRRSEISDLIKYAQHLSCSFPEESDINHLITQLRSYVKRLTRESYCASWNDGLMDQNEVVFIHKLLVLFEIAKKSSTSEQPTNSNAIQELNVQIKKDINAITLYLAEKNIQQFKGFFSSTLYDILKKYQNFPINRQEIIKEETPLPDVLINLIGEYDTILDCKKNSNFKL